VGASAEVELQNGRRIIAQVDGGNGHSGVRSPALHFGLDEVDADTPVAVEIRYRDRRGTPGTLRLGLMPGWHTLVLPDVVSNTANTGPGGYLAASTKAAATTRSPGKLR